MKPPVVSMRMPGVDRRTFAALADGGGCLWHAGDCEPDSPEERLETVMGYLALAVEEAGSVECLRKRWARDFGSLHLPTVDEARQLCDASVLLRPVLGADDSFRNLMTLRGAMLARAAFAFTGPTMELLRSAVEHATYFNLLPGWLDTLGWFDLVGIAKQRDTAAQAILQGHAIVEGDTPYDLMIRLKGARHEA